MNSYYDSDLISMLRFFTNRGAWRTYLTESARVMYVGGDFEFVTDKPPLLMTAAFLSHARSVAVQDALAPQQRDAVNDVCALLFLMMESRVREVFSVSEEELACVRDYLGTWNIVERESRRALELLGHPCDGPVLAFRHFLDKYGGGLSGDVSQHAIQ